MIVKEFGPEDGPRLLIPAGMMAGVSYERKAYQDLEKDYRVLCLAL